MSVSFAFFLVDRNVGIVCVLAQWVIFRMHRCCWRDSHISWSGSDAEVVNIEVILNFWVRHFVMLFIFILNCLTLSSYLWRLEKVDPTWTLNFLSERKLFLKLGNLPRSPMLCRSFIIPNFPVVSLAFSRSKVLFLDVGLSYADFQFDHMIQRRSPLSEYTLRTGENFLDSRNQTNLL